MGTLFDAKGQTAMNLRATEIPLATEKQQRQVDAQLFELLNGVLASRRGEDRRRGARHAYGCRQLLAPLVGEELPDQSAFFHVHCQDLSAGGFSFITTDMPPGDRLVVALGRAPFMLVVAHIVRVEVTQLTSGVQYTIGCRFVNRVEA